MSGVSWDRSGREGRWLVVRAGTTDCVDVVDIVTYSWESKVSLCSSCSSILLDR